VDHCSESVLGDYKSSYSRKVVALDEGWRTMETLLRIHGFNAVIKSGVVTDDTCSDFSKTHECDFGGHGRQWL
jgi:hypothetical protein